MEFKGTKGKWSLAGVNTHPVNNDEQVAFIQTESHCMDIVSVENDKINREEFKYNSLLISKAPEMLEMLKEMLKELEFHGFYSSKTTNEARELIKEATGF